MTPIDQARNWLSKQEPAISGSGGHDQTFHIAAALVEGFSLSIAEARPLLSEYSARCQPPWTEREIDHKLESAYAKRTLSECGKMLRKGVRWKLGNAPRSDYGLISRPTPQPAQQPKAKAAKYDVPDSTELPDPMPDGARAFLRAVFAEGEGIQIQIARTGDDGRELPKDGGVTLSREEWLRKLDDHKGNPNGFLRTGDKNGIFVRINPMKPGGNRDDDVTDYRHALLEFDEIDKVEQFGVIEASRIPCAAIISSGNRSIHAWVKVHAASREEYDARVKTLYEHFANYKPDEKNKNPSRFSRLPFCERGKNRQELLALNFGEPTFKSWENRIKWKPKVRLKKLLSVDTSQDPSCVLGFRDGKALRYLCKGKAAWILGPSGIGKSSLGSQFDIAFALGKSCFGIAPNRPLKTLVVQAENDEYDLAEMVQGVVPFFAPENNQEAFYDELDQRIVIRTETRLVHAEFVSALREWIDEDKPDVVRIDPLLSFAGINVSDQEAVSHFLRVLLTPVLEETGVILLAAHHTGKPKDEKYTKHWTAIDWAYAGLGSSELANWARAVMILNPVDEHLFRLILAKRGNRAGAHHPNGAWANTLWLRHASKGIHWEQIDPPEEHEAKPETKEKKDKPKTKVERLASANLHSVISKIPSDGESANALGKRLSAFSRGKGDTLGETQCRTALLDALVENGKLIYSPESGKYMKGPQA